MLEMLIQDRGIAGSIYSALDGLKGSIHNLMDLFDFAWGWDSASEEIWRSNIEKLSAVIEANPGMQGEIEDIVKKYSSKKGVV